MQPNDDDVYEGDWVSIIPWRGTQLPGPVVASARQRLSQLILAGDGGVHTAFHLNYGDRSWVVIGLQEPSGGYKLIFEETGGCANTVPFIYASRWGETTDTPIGYIPVWDPDAMTTSIEVEILNDTPVETDKVKKWKPPLWLRGMYNDHVVTQQDYPSNMIYIPPNDDPFNDGGTEVRVMYWNVVTSAPDNVPTGEYLRSGVWRPAASIYTGQMRHMIQCCYARRPGAENTYTSTKRYNPNDIPLKAINQFLIPGPTSAGQWGYSVPAYGIVEYPFPRDIGIDAEDEKANSQLRRYYLVEISPNGIYYTKLNIKTPWTPCGWSNAMPRQLRTQMMSDLYTDGTTRWKRLKTAAEMHTAIYSIGCTPHPHSNFAFSYSGRFATGLVARHELVGTSPTKVDDNVVTRFTIQFVENPANPPTDPVPFLTVTITQDEQVHLSATNSGSPFLWPAALWPSPDANHFDSVFMSTQFDDDNSIAAYNNIGLPHQNSPQTQGFLATNSEPFVPIGNGSVAPWAGTFDTPLHVWYWGEDLVQVRAVRAAGVNTLTVSGGPFSYTADITAPLAALPTTNFVYMPWLEREGVAIIENLTTTAGPPPTVTSTIKLFVRGAEFSTATVTTPGGTTFVPTGVNNVPGLQGEVATFAMGGAMFYQDFTLNPEDQEDNALIMVAARGRERDTTSTVTNPTHDGIYDLPHAVLRPNLVGFGILTAFTMGSEYDLPLTFVGRM